MPAEDQNISIPAGDSQRISVDVTNAAQAPVALNSAVGARWQVFHKPVSGEPEVKIQKSLADGTLAISGASLLINLLPDDTENLAPGDYYQEAEITFPDGVIKTVMRGTLTVTGTLIRNT